MANLKKHFRRADGGITKALDGVTVDVQPGEFLILLGPSGCGKTTMLRSLAGLEQPDSGRIQIHGKDVYDSSKGLNRAPEQRALSMIFQSYALWPHLTVADNIAYPLRYGSKPRPSKTEISAKVDRILKLTDIGHLAKQYPGQISGGQQQRVALARALVRESDLVLFDEPLSNVDAKVREQLRLELLSMQTRLGFSAVYVTHDQGEAMGLGDRIAVLREGRIEQLASPQEVYRNPASRYVAHFVGTSDELEGKVATVHGDGTTSISTPLGTVIARATSWTPVVGDEVVVLWRPEQLRLSTDPASGANTWDATIETTLFLGSHVDYVLDVAGHKLRARDSGRLLSRGETVTVTLDRGGAHIFPADQPKS
ncbi:ABC transporter ATP-binding protein [Microbacterium sp. LRZ72]|uniref:ABC transporter ATP-binding protein n=1 Tax=Microbacterium sp. LRZ72 TaxID=2942481 RepID=UPI0029B6BC4A|nr:ABC transporter ATP-binding protein [Microbacterium sp. LRZ72]MDX2377556.1 ABC transporter ATP-binding protein [Microbacterium sp. LRZ72]